MTTSIYRWARVVGGVSLLLLGATIVGRPPMSAIAVALWIVTALFVLSIVVQDRLAASSISPVLIVCGLAAIYGVIVPRQLIGQQQTFLLHINYAPWLWSASALCGFSALFFCIGYVMPRKLQAPRTTPAVEPSSSPTVQKAAFGLLLMTMLLFAYRVSRYGLGGWTIRLGADRSSVEGATAYVTYAPQYLAGVALYLWHTSPSRRQRLFAKFLCVGLTFYFFASGVRYQVIVMLGAMALLYYWRRSGRVLPPIRYLVAATLVGFLILGIGGQLRSKAAGGTTSVDSAAQDSFEITLPLAGLMAHTEKSGYLFGSSYAYLLYQTVPRTLWSTKPLPPTVVALAEFTNSAEGRAFPLWGEMYLNFGWYGVAVGMTLFGYGIRKWLKYWQANRTAVGTLDVIAALTIPLMVQWVSRGLFVQLVYNTLGLLVGPLLLLVFERRLRRRAEAIRQRIAIASTRKALSNRRSLTTQ